VTPKFLLLLVIFGFWIEASPAKAAQADSRCGVFSLEGRLRQSPSHLGYLELVTDAEARSERRIVLGKMKASDLHMTEGLRVAVVVSIPHVCVGECFGSWLETSRMLAPFEPLRSFTGPSKAEPCVSYERARSLTLGEGA